MAAEYERAWDYVKTKLKSLEPTGIDVTAWNGATIMESKVWMRGCGGIEHNCHFSPGADGSWPRLRGPKDLKELNITLQTEGRLLVAFSTNGSHGGAGWDPHISVARKYFSERVVTLIRKEEAASQMRELQVHMRAARREVNRIKAMIIWETQVQEAG